MMPPKIDPDSAERLYCAAIVGVACLAAELVDLGISDPDESLQDARFLRRDLLAEVERLRRGG